MNDERWSAANYCVDYAAYYRDSKMRYYVACTLVRTFMHTVAIIKVYCLKPWHCYASASTHPTRSG